jgi:hypothetical protein
MNLGLVKRVRDLIWEYTRRQTRNHFRYPELVCIMEHVVIDKHVVTQKRVLRNSINHSSVGDRRKSFPYLVLHVII